MAERRMFAKTIIDSDAFLEMPMTAQLLYFHLAMRADDDGFINRPKTIMRMIGAKGDDMTVLCARKFVLGFDDGIVVIKHWRIHNYIRKDTYQKTKYVEDMELLALDKNNAYTFNGEEPEAVEPPEIWACDDPSTIRQRFVDDPSTQDRLGKDRLGKDRLGKDRERERTPTGSKRESGKRFPVAYQEVADLYNRLCPSLSRVTALSDARKKAIKARLKKYSLKDLSRAFAMAEESDFLKGANNRDWSANFDWILKDANLAKILDGNYANRVKNKTGRGSPGDHVDDYLLGVINGEIKL